MTARALTLAALITAALACAPEEPTTPETQTTPVLSARQFAEWLPAISAEAIPGTHPNFNTPDLEGCPFVSRDGKRFFMASNRPGGLNGIDIWMSTRAGGDDPWGEPVNVGAPVNSSSNDFCPTLARDGHTFYFVSNRPGGCGGADIYVSRMRENGEFEGADNLGCEVNSAGDEASPFPLMMPGVGPVLYFSSNRAGGVTPEAPGAVTGDSDLYFSESHGGVFGAAQLVPGVNSAAEDGQPNVRSDGLELFFFSTRPTTLGASDIYSSTRATPFGAWSEPDNLGANVNSAGPEARPSLSWDGTTLYFGSVRAVGEGMSDIYVTTRARLNGVAR